MTPQSSYEPASILFLMWAAKSFVLLALAWVLTASLQRHAAAMRHRIWAIAIVTSLLLPLAATAVPSWHILHKAPRIYTPPPRVPPVAIAGEIVPAPAPAEHNLAEFSGAFLALWALGTAIVLLRVAIGFAQLARTSANARVAPL